MSFAKVRLQAFFLFGHPAITVADDPVALEIKRLTLESASKIAESAVAACRQRTIQIAVVVMDRSGNVQVALRDTLAVDLTLRIAREKSYTALSFNVPTSQLGARARSPLGNLDGLMMVGGGLPINTGGYVYRAIGVSGAPTATVDEVCATAGLDAVIEDLEMTQ